MKFSLVALTAFVAAVAAQDINSLPACGQLCVNNMVAAAQKDFGCAAGDAKCYCADARFGAGLKDCSAQACGGDVSSQVVSYGNTYCQNAASGAAGTTGTGTTTGGAGSTATSAASSASSVAASGSSALSSAASSASGAAASAANSASSALSSASSSIAGAVASATSKASSAASSATGASSSSAAAGAMKTAAPLAGAFGMAALLLI